MLTPTFLQTPYKTLASHHGAVMQIMATDLCLHAAQPVGCSGLIGNVASVTTSDTDYSPQAEPMTHSSVAPTNLVIALLKQPSVHN